MGLNTRITTVLLDLDGTLIPMDTRQFTEAYFAALTKKAAPYGYPSQTFVSAVWAATKAMVKNDGKHPNDAVFWKRFCELLGDEALKLRAVFDAFYLEEFDHIRTVAQPNPYAKPLVDYLNRKSYTVVLATNPLFPKQGNLTRMKWVGLEDTDFACISSYEDSSFCKPNPAYYQALLTKVGKTPEECLMVGNDVHEDMAASALGINVYLTTDYLIPSETVDTSQFSQGRFADFYHLVTQA